MTSPHNPNTPTSQALPTLPTRVARAEHGDNRFRGHAINADLLGRESMASMASLAIGGPRLDGEAREVLEDLAVAVTVADPRIWPLKVVRIAGAYGSKFAAFAAGCLVMDGSVMSVDLNSATAKRLVELDPIAAEMPSDVELAAHLDEAWPGSRPPGFGVPGREIDERVTGIRERMRSAGREPGRYFRLFERVVRVMRKWRNLEPNLTIALASVALDLGFSADRVGSLAFATSLNAFLANAVEGAEQAPDVLQSLPEHIVRYEGPAPRKSPRLAAGREAVTGSETRPRA